MALNDALLTFMIKHQVRGKNTLLSLFTRLGFRKFIFFKAKYGIMLKLNPQEYIDTIIIREDFYESEITDELLKHLKDGGTFWDIGANIGIHSIAIKKSLQNTKVYSFEPNPKTLAILCDNISLNKLDIKICGSPLFDKSGLMTLHLAEGNSGMTTLKPWDKAHYELKMECATTTGDALISSGYEIPSVIKLDVEGSELNILMGSKQILASPVLKAVVFEAVNDLPDNLETDEIAILLRSFGFDNIKQLPRHENTHHGLSNYIALRG